MRLVVTHLWDHRLSHYGDRSNAQFGVLCALGWLIKEYKEAPTGRSDDTTAQRLDDINKDRWTIWNARDDIAPLLGLGPNSKGSLDRMLEEARARGDIRTKRHEDPDKRLKGHLPKDHTLVDRCAAQDQRDRQIALAVAALEARTHWPAIEGVPAGPVLDRKGTFLEDVSRVTVKPANARAAVEALVAKFEYDFDGPEGDAGNPTWVPNGKEVAEALPRLVRDYVGMTVDVAPWKPWVPEYIAKAEAKKARQKSASPGKPSLHVVDGEGGVPSDDEIADGEIEDTPSAVADDPYVARRRR